MERRLKERLTGAAVLVMLAVIFIPMVLDNSPESVNRITETNIPPRPDTDFRSRIISPQDVPDLTETQQAPDTPQASSTGETGVQTSTEGNMQPTPSAGTDAGNSSQEAVQTSASETEIDDTSNADAWVVQLGSFSSQSNANSLVARLTGCEWGQNYHEQKRKKPRQAWLNNFSCRG
jgi:DedD protein